MCSHYIYFSTFIIMCIFGVMNDKWINLSRMKASGAMKRVANIKR